ncbi:SusC/RagA family TonB-linked outer membrane protein [Pedobacter sp. JY14-1]|uniref:SusC/RagA family TonB-linked outer membrane protein n=1 Tax=Pedobacter sp. JY14-1 TaxID=3034151 RepID=UPI0023E218C8|nr:SusC/RagA family TonB-linked outer membrane protein [Pedobacter sp. JY14-1]
MYKITFNQGMLRRRLPQKILLIMKLIVIIMTTCLVQVSAAGFAQKLNFTKRGASLSQIFTEIRKQTGYFVIYSDEQVDDEAKLDVNFKNTDLKDVMDVIGKSQSLDYSFAERNISLKPKEKGFLDNIIARFQAIDVRGKVVDSLGNGLAGATVSVKNGKGSTSTDAAGNFQLKNVDEGAVLVVNYLGYITREIAASKEFMNVVLQQSASKLDEVQIQAYGVTSRRLSTGNISTIKAEDIAKQPVVNPLLALQGRIPGLNITPTTGLSGGSVKVRLRGQNSLNFKAEPLIVLNGLPVDNNVVGLGHFNLSDLSALSFLNSNDIESIDVLKDADATSIYGSRGANGVILITTKKGKLGRLSVDATLQTGIGNVPKKMEMLKTPDYLALRRQAYLNSGININSLSPALNNADVRYWDQKRYTDWQEELIGKSARYTDFQTSVSGGAASFQYLLGGNYHKETVVFPGDNADKKGNAHVSISGSSPDQRLKATMMASFQVDNNSLPGIDLTAQALNLAPNAPSLFTNEGLINYEPLPNGNRSWNNPYRELYKTYEARVTNLNAAGSFTYNLLDPLTFKVQFGYNELRGEAFNKIVPFAGRPQESSNLLAAAGFNTTGTIGVSVEPQVTYRSPLLSGDLDILVGAAYNSKSNTDQYIFASGATSDALLGSLAAATSYILSNNTLQYKYAAIFGRASYNFKNKYLFNSTIRRDGSSRFGPNKKYGTFGSLAAGWIFTEEAALKEHLPLLSFGKIRASYGSSGNDGIGDYAYFERFNPVDVDDLYQGVRGYRTSGLFNSYYSWEVTRKLEVGLDLGFCKDKLLLNFSAFRNRSDNQLIANAFPSIAGPGQPIYNFPALIQNSGLEVTATANAVNSQNFTWKLSFNISKDRNKLVSYPDIQNSVIYQSVIGKPFYGEVRVFKAAGVDSKTGLYQFYQPDGQITSAPDDSYLLDEEASTRILTIPKYYGGISNSFTYKKFSLDIFLQFTKQMGKNPMVDFIGAAGNVLSNLPIEFLDRWQREGDVKRFQKVYRNYPDEYLQAAGRAQASDFGYVDASFLRLKNVALSYSISNSSLTKLGLNQLRFFLHGQNLLTFTSYRGLDPETLSTSTLPQLRIITTGLQTTF